MKKIKVNAESLPKRCEICHKTEFYNPEENYCSLCNKSIIKIENSIIIQSEPGNLKLKKVSAGVIASALSFINIYLISYLILMDKLKDLSNVVWFTVLLSWPILISLYVIISLLFYISYSNPILRFNKTKSLAKYLFYPLLFSSVGELVLLMNNGGDFHAGALFILILPLYVVWKAANENNFVKKFN